MVISLNLLIIGASGFVGSYISSEAEIRHINCIGTGNNNVAGKNIKFDIKNDCIDDVLQKYFSKHDKNIAIFCAAISKIDLCKQNKEECYLINVTKTKQIMEALSIFGFKIVYISTDNVFDGKNGYYSENDEPHPINEYGRQKLEAENYALQINDNNLVIRLSKIVGSKLNEAHPFSEWYWQVKNNQAILSIAGNIFSPTYVCDVSKGILLALDKDLKGIYHLCNNEHFSRGELALQFVQYFKFHAELYEKPLESFNFKDNRALKSYMSSDKFRNATGFQFTSMKTVMDIMKTNLKNH